MYTYSVQGERFICMMTVDNLVSSQAVISQLEYDIQHNTEKSYIIWKIFTVLLVILGNMPVKLPIKAKLQRCNNKVLAVLF